MTLTAAMERAARALLQHERRKDGRSAEYVEQFWSRASEITEHSGDCTNDPWSCPVCQVEDFRERAGLIIEAFASALPGGLPALKALADGAMGWQPIETAPTGEWLVTYRTGEDATSVALLT